MKKILFTLYSCWASAPQPTRRYGSWTLRPMRSAKRPSLKTNWFHRFITPPGAAPARRWSATSSRKRRWATLWNEYFVAAKYDIDKRPGNPGRQTRHTVDPDLPRIQYRGRPAGQDNRIHAGRRVYRRPSEDHRRNREEIATGGCNKERNDSCMRIVSVLLFLRALNTT